MPLGERIREELDTMTKEEAAIIEALKPYIVDYANELGARQEGHNLKFLCPFHDDDRPSMTTPTDRTSRYFARAKCFSCGANADIIGLHRKITGKGFSEAVRDLAKKYLGQEIKTPLTASSEETGANPFAFLDNLGNEEAIAYLEGRGLKFAKTHVSWFHIRSDKEAIYFPRYVISEHSRVCIDYQGRAFHATGKGDRYRRPRNTQARIYDPLGALEQPREGERTLVAITEGEIDCLSVYDAGREAEGIKNLCAVALSGVSMLRQLEAALKGIEDISRYGFILLTDGDKAGKDAALNMGKILEQAGAAYVTATDYPEGIKDPNDWIAKDRQGFIKHLCAISETFDQKAKDEKDTGEKERDGYREKYGASMSLAHLINDINSPIDPNPIKTGFPSLDGLLGGELEKGLVVLGAPSSLGKTTLMLQIADQIAQSDRRDIVFFTLEQSPQELIAKSLSRLTYLLEKPGESTAKSTLGILQRRRWKSYTPTEKAAIYDAVTAYRALSPRLYFHEAPLSGMNIEDIQAAVEEHIRVTKNKPIVFIDYLQIIKPLDRAHTDKQAVDATISGLKRLSAQYGLIVFVVSSLSRNYYYEQSTTQGFKDSGGIEYGADYALGLAFDWLYTEEAENPKDENGKPIKDNANGTAALRYRIKYIREMVRDKNEIPLRLTMLKHRNGQTETYARFMFVKPFNCFLELSDKLNHKDDKTLRELAGKALKAASAQIEEETPF